MKSDVASRIYKCSYRRLVLLFIAIMISLPMTDSGWIDEDTPMDKRTTISLIDGTEYNLVHGIISFYLNSSR